MNTNYQILCGIDVIQDSRIIKNLTNQTFLDRILLPQEKLLVIDTPRRLASIFSLKEAVIKALKITTDYWLSIEISYKENTKPFVTLSKEIAPQNLESIDCSVSHANGVTTSMVTLLLVKDSSKKPQ